jgi:hypothetical protein
MRKILKVLYIFSVLTFTAVALFAFPIVGNAAAVSSIPAAGGHTLILYIGMGLLIATGGASFAFLIKKVK